MPKLNAPLYSLNGGEVGPESLSRLDLERMQFAGSLYSNIMPRIVGSMTMRPGLEYRATQPNLNDVLIEHTYTLGEDITPVLSSDGMRFILDSEYLQRASVATTIQSGDFTDFTGWTDVSTGAAAAVAASNRLALTGVRFSTAAASQQISVSPVDQGVEHGLRIRVVRGPVEVRLGATDGGSELFSRTLEDGDHSLAFTPTTASVYVALSTDVGREVLVDSCEIDAVGAVILDAPYGAAEIPSIKYRQSVDKVYLASKYFQQRVLIRWGNRSWSLQRYKVDDGPFRLYSGDISLEPAAYTGNTTLTASESFFDVGMTGRLFRLTQSGQEVVTNFTGEDQQGETVRISGVGSARTVNYTISGTFGATWTLEVATDDGSGSPTGWTTITQSTVGFTSSYTDTDDNVIKFLRFSIDVGDYTSGTVETSLDYEGGSQSGIARMTGYTSDLIAEIEILEQFYSLDPTQLWDYSTFSDFDGWPNAVETWGGRLYWFRVDEANGSIPDSFNSFDDTVEGDSAPIARSLNSDGQQGAFWALAVQRLLVGTDVAEVSIRSSAFDEPLTAANWFPLSASTNGCADIRAVRSDADALYVTSDTVSLHRMSWDTSSQDYVSSDLTQLHEEICGGSSIKAIAVQRKPDTIVWLVLEDGGCRALTYEPRENVVAWSRVETDGLFKDVIATRSSGGDSVHFSVERNGALLFEKLSSLKDCRGGQANCIADSFVKFEALGTNFPVPHLDGQGVTVWADGVAVHDQGNLYAVAGGEVALVTPATDVVIGLPYRGRWKSTKLAYGAALGTALFQQKRVSGLGMYFTNTILDGVKVGRDFDHLFSWTTTKDDAKIPAGELQAEFDGQLEGFDGDWDTDSRICAEFLSPYPVTAAGLVMQVKTNDKG